MAEELLKFGCHTDLGENDITVHGCNLKTPELPLYGHNDHRIVMSLAVLCTLTGGQIYATCPETPAIQHRCMVPPEVSGTVTWAAENGSYTVNDPIVKLTDAKGREHILTLCQKWPIRTPRPAAERMTSPRPLITGQRVIDTMFPLA